jgi:glycerol uptake facilitator-like aquaporin
MQGQASACPQFKSIQLSNTLNPYIMFESVMSTITSIIIFVVVAISVINWIKSPSKQKPDVIANSKPNLNAPFSSENIVSTLFIFFVIGFLLFLAVILLGNASNPHNAFGSTFSLILGFVALAGAIFFIYVFYNHSKGS